MNIYCLHCKKTYHNTDECSQIKKKIKYINKFCCGEEDKNKMKIELEKYDAIILIKYIKKEDMIKKLKYCDIKYYDNSNKNNHIKNIVTYHNNLDKILTYKKPTPIIYYIYERY